MWDNAYTSGSESLRSGAGVSPRSPWLRPGVSPSALFEPPRSTPWPGTLTGSRFTDFGACRSHCQVTGLIVDRVGGADSVSRLPVLTLFEVMLCRKEPHPQLFSAVGATALRLTPGRPEIPVLTQPAGAVNNAERVPGTSESFRRHFQEI